MKASARRGLAIWLFATLASAPSLAGETGATLESEAVLGSGEAALHGTLAVPAEPRGARVPAVLLIAGSGPTDRDGNSTLLPNRNDSLRMLADALGQAGVASLRFDKRGVGASAKALRSEAEVRFETYVDDAAAWAQQLAADPRFGPIGIVGHSEGAAIGALVATRVQAAAFVSLAGAGRPIGEILRAQLGAALPPALAARNEAILRELEAGRTVDDVPTPLATLYRASVQPYLISQMRHAPAAEIAALTTMPVAIFQGDTDIQLTTLDARLLAAARPGAELHVVAGMNHVLKTVPADRARQVASYSDPTLPLAPQLVSELTDFLRRALVDAAPR